jgi:hypothetical protein
VSTSEFSQNLCAAFAHCEIEDSSLKIEVHQALSIQNLLSSIKCRLHFDFIVFAVDTRVASVLESLENNMYHIDKHYIAVSIIIIILE